MLVEKEVISPGQYWYTDQDTGLPRKLDVTPDLTRYWHEQGSAMLSAGLPIPVPYEHDFDQHPMTPKEKLLNNAGEVKEYRLKGDALWSVVDVQDPAVREKIGSSIRWTSPWISSFTDGSGKKWNNVISHLALTTRPRITKQQPFNNVAAALSMATAADLYSAAAPKEGVCLSRAGRLFTGKKTGRLRPRYPMAFSLWSGAALDVGDMPPKKGKPKGGNLLGAGAEPEPDDFSMEDEAGETPPPGAGGLDGAPGAGPMDPLADMNGDIGMEELLCDLLQALGVPMPDASNEAEFKRHLYEAVMSKIKELTSMGMGKQQKDQQDGFKPDQNKPPNQQPNAAQPQANPLIQQEQQPMYMSLEEIQKLPEPTKTVALAMHEENRKLRELMGTNDKIVASLRDAKLKEADDVRKTRVVILGKVSPGVKADLDAMLALPSMALSLGEGGAVVDPMAQTLAMLEKGLRDMPRLLTTDAAALSAQPHPTDADALSEAEEDKLADDMARRMGAPPEQKRAS